jgi:colanic acid biosynthesis glycosyl transferase WcaI
VQNIKIITELYYPEETSTGYFVTGIAEGLAKSKDTAVSVLCAQPTYSQKGVVAAQFECRNDVSIQRLAAPSGDKNALVGRLWNTLSLTLRFGFSMFGTIRRGDLVMVVTNPPSLPLLVGWIATLKGAVPVLLVHDVYPDVLVPTGITQEGSLLYKGVDLLQRHMLRQMQRIVVLGRDMEERILAKLPTSDRSRFSIIPNWGETAAIHPDSRVNNCVRARHDLNDKFIIQFSGNLGRTHGLEDLVALAQRLKPRTDIHVLVFGWGAGRDWLEDTIKELELINVTLLPHCEKAELGDYLTACDLFFMPFKKGMEGISVPSRLYNVMSAGNPVLAITGSASELAQVVDEESMGWVVEAGDVDSMIAVVEEAVLSPEQLAAMSKNARSALEAKYTREHVVRQFAELFAEMNVSIDGQ